MKDGWLILSLLPGNSSSRVRWMPPRHKQFKEPCGLVISRNKSPRSKSDRNCCTLRRTTRSGEMLRNTPHLVPHKCNRNRLSGDHARTLAHWGLTAAHKLHRDLGHSVPA